LFGHPRAPSLIPAPLLTPAPFPPIRIKRRRSRPAMIHLTRLNGNPLVVNSDLIKYAESSPDTMLTLINGEKIVVLESCEDVVSRAIAYRARVYGEAAVHLRSLSLIPAADTAPVLERS
ncbi:MAG: flagellar FlbD family protein, partial [Acidobacteriaceae bacterium]